MRLIKLIIIMIFISLSPNIYADTCSYKEQTILNNDFSNVKLTYEIKDNNINILIYNLTENLHISYKDYDTEKEANIYYEYTDNGKYVITRNADNIEEYQFQIKSSIPTCFGKLLTTKKIIKPKYNTFSELEICDNKKLSNHSYCQKYITKNINKTENEVIKTLNEFLSTKTEKTTTQVVEDKKIDIKTIIIYSSSILLLATIITTIILVNKKRNEL